MCVGRIAQINTVKNNNKFNFRAPFKNSKGCLIVKTSKEQILLFNSEQLYFIDKMTRITIGTYSNLDTLALKLRLKKRAHNTLKVNVTYRSNRVRWIELRGRGHASLGMKP